jgi:dTDP-4-amino-4,6-dideoxygalactose transaminase
MNGQTKDALAKSTAGGWQYDIVYPGFKMNMPDVLAAIGLAQLRKYIATLHTERKRVVELYHSLFKGKNWAILPAFERVGTVPSYHLYLLRIEGANEQQRNQIINKIAAAEVSVNVHFTPLPMLAVFKEKGYDIANYPIAYQQYANVITLPVYPQLTTAEITYVAQTVIAATESVLD